MGFLDMLDDKLDNFLDSLDKSIDDMIDRPASRIKVTRPEPPEEPKPARKVPPVPKKKKGTPPSPPGSTKPTPPPLPKTPKKATPPPVKPKPEPEATPVPEPAPAPQAAPEAPQPVPVPEPAPAEADEAMFSSMTERLIEAALADGVLTPKEKQVLMKRAEQEGIDPDEFEMVLEARLFEKTEEMKRKRAKAAEREAKKQAKPTAPPPIPQPAATPPQPTNKYGEVRKCPSCGRVVQAFEAVCPDCHHEFSGVAANSSVARLNEALMLVDRQIEEGIYTGRYVVNSMNVNNNAEYARAEMRSRVIREFPVPNTKGDIYEFIITTAIKAVSSTTSQSVESLAWDDKCHECYDKARLLFKSTDDNMQKIQTLLLEKGLLQEEKKGLLKRDGTGNLIWRRRKRY